MYNFFRMPIATVLLIGFSTKSFAQFKSSGYEIGISAGTLIYQGDLTPDPLGYTRSLTPMIALHAAKGLNSSFSLRANLAFGKIMSDESQYSSPEFRQYRNFAFSASIAELSTTLMWNLYGNNADYDYRRFSPYLFAGIGGSLVHVQRDWSRLNTDYFDTKSKAREGLAVDIVNPLPNVIAVLPVGIGAKYFISPRVSVNAEFNYRFTSSDYLDGFKYAVNEKSKDRYYGVSVGLFYNFGKDKLDCPAFR